VYGNPKIAEVLLVGSEVGFDTGVGDTLDQLVREGGRMLDHACLTDVIIVRDEKGQAYRGEFVFSLEPVSDVEVAGLVGNAGAQDGEEA
jgi:hypothetical protein